MQKKRKLGVDTAGRSGLQLHFSFADVHLPLTAVTHEIERQRTITQVLLEIYMMTVFGMLDKDDKLSVKGAEVQDERAVGGDQAAHYLPRQLMVNDISLQDVAFKYSTELSNHIKGLFARTEKLPANYNRADSKAELQGVDEAFRQACRLVMTLVDVSSGGQDAQTVAKEAPNLIKSAVNLYQERGRIALHLAIKGLQEKLKGDKIFATEKERWTMQLEILQQYLKVSGIHHSINEELTTERIGGTFQTYSRYKK